MLIGSFTKSDMTHTSETLQAAFGYLFVEEVQALKDLVRMLPSEPEVLQIGAGAGTSSLAILEARDDVRLTTIDIEAGDSPFGSLFAEKKVVTEAGHINRLTQVHGDSRYVDLERDALPFHMIFIDGDHSYEGCRADIIDWMAHLVHGGIMAIHDYNKADAYNNLTNDKAPHPKVWDGVDRAVNELLLGKFEKVLKVRSLIAFRI